MLKSVILTIIVVIGSIHLFVLAYLFLKLRRELKGKPKGTFMELLASERVQAVADEISEHYMERRKREEFFRR